MTSFSTTDVVLVTGGNGHVAQHVICQLLSLPSGPKVRATVRSTSSITILSQVFSLAVEKGQLELQIVEDITIEGAFDNAVRGVTHIAHIASPITMNPQSIENDLLIPAIKGTTSILASALPSPTLKSVVITSSFAAVFDPKRGFRPGYTYSSKDWNPLSYSEAADPSLDLAQYPGHMRPWITYFASKKLAEEAAWKLCEEHSPSWRLSTVLPTYIGGPTVLPLTEKHGSVGLSFSGGLLWKIAVGDGRLPNDNFPFWVDVRDVAKAHINALIEPNASGSRWILAPSSFTYKQIAQAVRDRFPDMRPFEDTEEEFERFDIDARESLEALNLTSWRSLTQMVVDTVEQVRTSPFWDGAASVH